MKIRIASKYPIAKRRHRSNSHSYCTFCQRYKVNFIPRVVTKLRNATIGSAMPAYLPDLLLACLPARSPIRPPACPVARKENLGSQKNFCEILYLNNFRKSVDKF
jgi:hypothetical protein